MSTRPRRDSVVSHRRAPSLHSLEPAMPQDLSSRPYPSLRLLSSPDSKHSLSLAAVSAMLASNLRKWRIRGPLIALLALLTLAMFAILHQHLNDPQPTPVQKPLRAQQRQTVPRPLHRTALPKLNRPQITMTPDEELAAVIAFMSALPSNALPDYVNVSYVDPDLILDFDTRSPNAPQELNKVVAETWRRLPVVLLSEKYSPLGREIKTILGEYNLKPSPIVFDIDQRADVAVIAPVLYRLTKESNFPILLLGGKSAGSISTIRQLQKSGELRSMIAATTAIIDGGKKKKKGKRDSSQ